MSSVEKLNQSHHGAWLPLFRGYVEFYKANLSENQYELTWNRLLDDQYNLYGLVAVDDGKYVESRIILFRHQHGRQITTAI